LTLHSQNVCVASTVIAFAHMYTRDLDLWSWKPFQQFWLTWWIFISISQSINWLICMVAQKLDRNINTT